LPLQVFTSTIKGQNFPFTGNLISDKVSDV